MCNKSVFTVQVTYTDGSQETQCITAFNAVDAKVLSETWVDMRKTVEKIEVLGELIRGGRRKK